MDGILVALAYETLNRVRKAGTHPEAQEACWLIINKWNRSLNPAMFREPGDAKLREWYGPECWRE